MADQLVPPPTMADQGRGSPLIADALTTEFATTPLGIGTPHPRLGWRPTGASRIQVGYQIVVGAGSDGASTPDVWDSGEVASGDCSGVRYAGRPLLSRQRYWWAVRMRDDTGRVGTWSLPAEFEMGLLAPEDWTAAWIGAASTAEFPPNPLLRREFTLAGSVRAARLYLCGLGYSVGYLNGDPVTDAVLDTPVTAYDRRVITTTHDVTRLLRDGNNVIAIALGRGFYAGRDPERFGWHRSAWADEPKLLAQLEIEHTDGSTTVIGTDDQWHVTEGPTTFDAAYGGESYDARLDHHGWTEPRFDVTGWRPASVVAAPAGDLESVTLQPIRVVREVKPVRVDDLGADGYVIDFGEHIAGWVRLSARGPAGTTVRLRYGELLGDDGRLAPIGKLGTGAHPPLGERFQVDEYTLAGDGPEEWEPQFTYKGFRYVEVAGLPEPADQHTLLARVVHTDAARTSAFGSSEPVYEWVHDALQTTMLNNLHGLPTDTPTYEKCGWLGDAHVAAEAMLYGLDLARVMDKWLRDIADSQADDGSLPSVAPAPGPTGFGWWGTTPAWTGAYVALVRRYWEVYGDRSAVAEHYPNILRHLDHLLDASDDGLSGEWWGDWTSPGYPRQPPEDTRLAGTAYLYKQLQDALTLADLLSADKDAERLRQGAEHVSRRFNTVFLDRTAGCYRTETDDGYRQTSNLLPLAFGLAPDDLARAIVETLVADIRGRDDHLNTGVLGTSVLFDVLSDHGHVDLAHAVASTRTCPSYGYWFEQGSTTLWERWEGHRSRDHYFFGSVAAWFIRQVAGLSPAAPGYRRVRVDPRARGPLTHASARLHTVRGEVACSWRLRGDGFELTTEIPASVEAEIHLPPSADGSEPVLSGGIAVVRSDPTGIALQVGPGRHTAVVPTIEPGALQ